MAQGIFNLKQVVQAIQQNGWPNSGSSNTFGAYFRGSGSGDYLTGPTTGTLNFSTGAFTVEFWAFLNSFGGGGLSIAFSASNASADFQLGISDGSGVYWHNSGTQLTGGNTSKALGKWVHVALVRSGTTASLFCNGVRSSTTTNSAAINLTNFNIGSYSLSPSAYMIAGWISNLRITNNAVYDPTATTLALPTSPLTAISGTQLLTLQNATIIDNSTNALTITTNGQVGMHTVAPFGVAVRPTPAVEYLVVAGGAPGGGGAGYSGGGGGAGGVRYGIGSVPNGQTMLVTVGAGGTASAGQVTGTAGGDSVFGKVTAIGGGPGSYGQNSAPVAGGSGGGAGNNNTIGVSTRGAQGVAGQGFAGGAGWPSTSGGSGGGGGAGTPGQDAFRAESAGNGGQGVGSIISGTLTTYSGGGGGGGHATNLGGQGGTGGGGNGATGSGTNAQAGSTNRGSGGGGAGNHGTRIAGNGGSGFVAISYPDTYAAASATTGTPTVSTSGSGSIFTNANSFVYTPSSSTYNLGSSNFTIEMWINVSTDGNLIRAIEQYGFALYYGGGQLVYYLSSDGASWNVTSGTNGGAISVNTWNHIALVRNGNVFTPYVNGVAGTTTTSSATLSSTTGFCIMSERPLSQPNGSGVATGYASNFRAVIGTAVYTSNFTPPTAPLTAITNTKVLLNSVSGAYLADSSSLSAAMLIGTNTPTWNQLSPFTVTGYKNRVYSFTSSGSITF